MNSKVENQLASYVDALRPIIYINHFDFCVVDNLLRKIGDNVSFIEYNNALGIIDFETKSPQMECDLEKFLELSMDEGFNQPTFIILKDVHHELKRPEIIAYLKRIAEDNLYREDYSATIFIVSTTVVIPNELENYITVFDIPLPTEKEIAEIIHNFINDIDIKVEQDVLDEIAVSFKGLNEFQINQILKEWLRRKAIVFQNLDKAIKFGVDVPKGIMIVGMPGCGKSLTAKATASLFEIPLVRLDVGRLLGKYVGESEENMRKALKLSESISPCVLWIDELEKAFAGVGSEGGDVTTRLFGQFLTWMQEKENTVFIVATANDISKIPPEFLRKGRFDELFFVDLPNDEERRKIIEIHLKKRKKWNKNIDSIALIEKTEGFNGADLEAVVKEAIEDAFIDGDDKITTEALLKTIKNTKSISSTMKDKIDKIRETIK